MGLAVKTLREKLLHYVENMEDKKIKAFYTIVQTDLEEDESIYTNAFKAELNQRYTDYKTGKSKMITAAESKKRVQHLLKSKQKK